jgi:hypothetical protein
LIKKKIKVGNINIEKLTENWGILQPWCILIIECSITDVFVWGLMLNSILIFTPVREGGGGVLNGYV